MDQQKPAQDELITCPNESCGKAFKKPLKAMDFQASPGEVYEACPQCLTRLSSIDKKIATGNEEDIENSEAETVCSHRLGYLCNRPEGKIPDECIVCKNVVPCMLKGLRE